MSVEKTCGHCAKSFIVPNRRHETVKFCSLACKTQGRRRTVVCVACGQSFERQAHLAASKYCSRECYHSTRPGVRLNVERGERHYRTCEVCAVSFRVTLTRKDTARFCSRACQSKSVPYRQHMSEVQRGAKSHSWKGGLYQGRYGYVRVRGTDRSSREHHFQHRYVIETAMLEQAPDHPFLVEINGKKKLNPKIDVHHIDLDRANNAFSNLLAVTRKAHGQLHGKNRTPDPWECWPHSHIAGDPSLTETSTSQRTLG